MSGENSIECETARQASFVQKIFPDQAGFCSLMADLGCPGVDRAVRSQQRIPCPDSKEAKLQLRVILLTRFRGLI